MMTTPAKVNKTDVSGEELHQPAQLTKALENAQLTDVTPNQTTAVLKRQHQCSSATKSLLLPHADQTNVCGTQQLQSATTSQRNQLSQLIIAKLSPLHLTALQTRSAPSRTTNAD
jgi:hypothetical protein